MLRLLQLIHENEERRGAVVEEPHLQNFGRPLRNPLKIDRRPPALVAASVL